jgi:hypothetical protein
MNLYCLLIYNENRNEKWKNKLLIRWIVVISSALNGLLFPFDKNPPVPLFIPIIPLIYGVLFIPIAFRKGVKEDTTINWSRPSWTTEPFSGPPHFFHMVGWSFFSLGLVSSVKALIQGNSFVLQSSVLTFGLGIIIGIEIFYKFVSNE